MKHITIIPAAGLATRMRPLSNSTSKTMLTVNGKPIISHIIDEVRHFSDKIVIVYGASNDIKNYCTLVYPDLDISFVKQQTPLGPLHAIWNGLNAIKKETASLTVWLGDTIAKGYVPSSMNDVVYSDRSDFQRWCLIDDSSRLYDKPKTDPGTTKALIGIYSFSSLTEVCEIVGEIMDDRFSRDSEYQISELLEKLQFNLIGPEDVSWYDCGDLASLYESRARLLTSLSVDENVLLANSFNGTVQKSGPRCSHELAWYLSIPSEIKYFTPTLYDAPSDDTYVMELCSGTSVQDIILYEDIKEHNIRYLIQRVLKTFDVAFLNQESSFITEFSETMYFTKFNDRIQNYNYEWMDNNDRAFILSEINIARENAKELFPAGINTVQFIHGDFHFGNILFDFVSGKIKMIDPRGSWENLATTQGNVEYDIVKMYQSAYSDYIWICGGLPVDMTKKEIIIDELDKYVSSLGYNINQINYFKDMSNIFMAGCINFHDNNPKKQKLMWDTALNSLITQQPKTRESLL